MVDSPSESAAAIIALWARLLDGGGFMVPFNFEGDISAWKMLSHPFY